MMFESVHYKGTLKSPLLFEIVLRLHQFQMKGDLILYVIHILGTRIIEAGIDGISGRNNLGVMTRGINPLQFVPVDEGAVEISPGLKGWLISWWGENLKKMRPYDWFEVKEIIRCERWRQMHQKP